jgi:hypothetical protein
MNRGKIKNNFNLDLLTDIFSFFTPLESSISRQVCKWWNDLLSKDNTIVANIKKHNLKVSYEDNDHVLFVIHYGYLSIVKWFFTLDSIVYMWKPMDWISVITNQLHILKWLYFNHKFVDLAEMSVWAAKTGNLKILKWLIKKDNTLRYFNCSGCKTWKKEIVDFLHSLRHTLIECDCHLDDAKRNEYLYHNPLVIDFLKKK